MSTVVQARDTFLHFIADNTSLTVHALRTDTSAPDAAVFQQNAINVHFANVDLGVDVTILHAVIDIVFDNENDAVDAMQTVWAPLNAAFYTPLMDYTTPTSPVAVGGNILWERGGVKFRMIRSDFYAHFSCSLRLRF